MTMLACLLLLGTAMVALCHVLPLPRPGRPFRAALFVVGGFILAQGGLSSVIAGLGLAPKGPFHDVLNRLTNYDGERPVILLIGSSFSGAGIDPDALADVLGSSGRAAVVLPIAVGGAPHLEAVALPQGVPSRRDAKAETRAVRNRGWLRQCPFVPGSPDAVQRPHDRDDGRFERVVGTSLSMGRL
jgi:hypothetical protein